MRRLLLLAAVCAAFLAATAGTYTRVTKFDKIGTEFRDTFLIVCEHAGNAYIFDGQSAANKNYKLIEKFSGNTITGNYTLNECVLFHNKYHGYDKLCSMLARGDGERASGYYIGGVGSGNGIQFSNGQLDVEFVWQGEFGVDITSKSGGGKFQFNTTDKVFKFYSQSEQTRPILFVKGNGEGYVGEDETVNQLDVNYVQADLYARFSDFNKKLFDWDLRLLSEESDEKVPGIETEILTNSMTAIAGNYSQDIPSGQVGWASSYSYVNFPSKEGVTQGKLTTLKFSITPVSKYNDYWYNYHIELSGIDSNRKRWKLDKVLPIFCTFTDRDPNNTEQDLPTVDQKMDEKLSTAITQISADKMQIFANNGHIFCSTEARIFDLLGNDVTAQNGNLHGIFVVKSANKVAKIAVK